MTTAYLWQAILWALIPTAVVFGARVAHHRRNRAREQRRGTR